MEFIIIPFAAFAASILTFFSGFGLGTILLPVFAIWFPIDLAVALTAVVHLFNNVFKFGLVRKHVDKTVAIRFGLPAILSAFAGAALLVRITESAPFLSYNFLGKYYEIMPVKLMIALIMIIFTLIEVIPKLKNFQVSPRHLALGGLLSGFFGGLSGHQGALRSAFLIRMGLTKESFIATGTVIACLIDFARIGVYSKHFSSHGLTNGSAIIGAATFSAFAGAYVGSKLLRKITLETVQIMVSLGLFLLAIALGAGII